MTYIMFRIDVRMDICPGKIKCLQMQKDDNNKQRRGFLKFLFAFGAGAGLLTLTGGKAKAEVTEKVKMLTPDGKLVEIDRSQIENERPEVASNAEVLQWMNKKQTP